MGLLTYSLEDENCEIVTIDSTKPGIGIGTLPLTPYTRRVAAVSTATLLFPLRRISYRLVPLQIRYRWCLDQMCPISVIPTFSTNASSSDALA